MFLLLGVNSLMAGDFKGKKVDEALKKDVEKALKNGVGKEISVFRRMLGEVTEGELSKAKADMCVKSSSFFVEKMNKREDDNIGVIFNNRVKYIIEVEGKGLFKLITQDRVKIKCKTEFTSKGQKSVICDDKPEHLGTKVIEYSDLSKGIVK